MQSSKRSSTLARWLLPAGTVIFYLPCLAAKTKNVSIQNSETPREYIARNPERAGLVEADAYASYGFTGCLVPGYPELRPFDPDYWDQFDKIISFLRKEGLMRT